ncbi:hypothetical protein GCM10011390_10750 [Aureimonas endophytica]|uniref:DUF1214 domain-containing protein n=1 Tax=Aureimonas endophytica TaxID=2027858 RepID=A0A916ZGC3_9HYPH|nr:DUF1214 domain-containing protein [Aureimonas endophytica]GGD93892.1 hypothetical protein GCM10011390_10750 [Aureimonas endophytica]
MRFLLLVLTAVAIALGLGGWSAKRALDAGAGSGLVRIGVWTADPTAGSVDADPYEKARLSRAGNLTLGIGEGVQFKAAVDAGGTPLRRECSYRLSGELPLARVWTLAAYTPNGRLIQPRAGRPSRLVSHGLMRAEDNSVEIEVAPDARPGNWLAIDGKGPLVLALTLYDTPASTSSGLGRTPMLAVERKGCPRV